MVADLFMLPSLARKKKMCNKIQFSCLYFLPHWPVCPMELHTVPERDPKAQIPGAANRNTIWDLNNEREEEQSPRQWGRKNLRNGLENGMS